MRQDWVASICQVARCTFTSSRTVCLPVGILHCLLSRAPMSREYGVLCELPSHWQTHSSSVLVADQCSNRVGEGGDKEENSCNTWTTQLRHSVTVFILSSASFAPPAFQACIHTYVPRKPINPPLLALKDPPHTRAGSGSDHSVAFVRRWVCNDITTLGGVSFPGPSPTSRGRACRVQMQRHFLWDESVQVDVLEPVAPASAHRRRAGRATSATAASTHVGGRPWSTRAHTDARHGST